MNRLHLLIKSIVSVAILAFVVGCSHKETRTTQSPPPSVQKDHAVFLSEARAEARNLRSELAAIKIANAKRAANLRSFQEETAQLREREARLSSKLNDANRERDQLRRQNSELQARTGALPQLGQLVADIKSLQTSVGQMISSMNTLVGEMSKIKQDIVQNQRDIKRQTAMMSAVASDDQPDSPASESKLKIITVKWGDTLWRISRTHSISLKTLKDINELESDLIVAGQQLKVPFVTASKTNHSPEKRKDKKASVLKKGTGEPDRPPPTPNPLPGPNEGG